LNIRICYHYNLSAALISPSQQFHAPVDGRREWRLSKLEVRTIGDLVQPLWELTYTAVKTIVRVHFLLDPAIQAEGHWMKRASGTMEVLHEGLACLALSHLDQEQKRSEGHE
jgi:hypothetical protein